MFKKSKRFVASILVLMMVGLQFSALAANLNLRDKNAGYAAPFCILEDEAE